MTCNSHECHQGRKPCLSKCNQSNSDNTSPDTRTVILLYRWEYRRQRIIGNGVFVSAWRAMEYALQPLPF